MKPHIGEMSPDPYNWGCSHSLAPGHPECGVPVVWHGIVMKHPDHGDTAGMMCCDEHKPIMAAIAEHLHALGSACNLPSAQFFEAENECRVPGADLALAAMTEAEVSV